MSWSPKLNVITSHFTGTMACVNSQRSRHATPVAASPAPPSDTSQGPCWTCATSKSSASTFFVASVV